MRLLKDFGLKLSVIIEHKCDQLLFLNLDSCCGSPEPNGKLSTLFSFKLIITKKLSAAAMIGLDELQYFN